MAAKNDLKILAEELKREDEFFHDSLKNAWVQFRKGDHKEVCKVNNDNYRNRMYSYFLDVFQEGLTEKELAWTASLLEAYAKFECIQREVFLRVASVEGKYYYDLTNEGYEVIEISKNEFRTVNTDNVLFKRYDFQQAQCQPKPDKGSRITELKKYINIDKDKALLFIVYLITCFVPDIQHPVLILHGESGSGKSTISSIIKELVDPCAYDKVSLPDDEESLFLICSQNWLTVLDNVTKISTKQSDNLCKIVTGIATIRRSLYTDNRANISSPQGCIVLNCIANVAEREDLLNRSLIFRVKRDKNKSYKPAKELLEEFRLEKTMILHKVFEALAKAMAIYPTVNFDNIFRMSDFAKYGYAIAEVISGPGGGERFLTLYKENIETQESEAISENTLLSAIILLMKNRRTWRGLTAHLFGEIIKIVQLNRLNTHSDTMPKNPAAMTKKLNAHVDLLKRQGIEYKHDGHTNTGSIITLRKIL